jgi:hypothetical protein
MSVWKCTIRIGEYVAEVGTEAVVTTIQKVHRQVCELLKVTKPWGH